MANERSVVVLLSGGMDSAALLFEALNNDWTVHTLSVNYGQRHDREILYAAKLAAYCKVPHRIADLTAIQPLLSGSALTSPEIEVPSGHYTDDSMKLTVVPNRNMIMLAVAGGYAVSRGLGRVGTAVHAGDHTIYPDCRPAFTEAMYAAMLAGTAGFGDVEIWVPFVQSTKAEIARRGEVCGVPWDLTWSCYKGEEYHCGTCGTCVERREAFIDAGVMDPTVYNV